jgi:ABC-type nitrate/sulfonate/bicarbonate transport system ATPase subunit
LERLEQEQKLRLSKRFMSREAALLLASRVIVLTERPARIKGEFRVERPYPRHRDDPVLVTLRRQILETLGFPT